MYYFLLRAEKNQVQSNLVYLNFDYPNVLARSELVRIIEVGL